jgi:hypothetical protein
MYQQDDKAQAPLSQEFYFPHGGGVDPDLFMPADRVQRAGRFSRWIQALPVFGRSRR